MSFYFGTPEQNAAILLDMVSVSGPGMPEGPLDELEEGELLALIVYLCMALNSARANGQGQDAINVLGRYLEEAIEFYCPLNPSFARDLLDRKRNLPVMTRDYWAKVARRALSES